MPGVNCGAFEGSLMELARRGALESAERMAVEAHLDNCIACRREFDRQVRLSQAARSLSAEAGRFSAPPRVERALLAELDAARAFQRRQRFRYAAWSGAIAASLALVFWLSSGPAQKAVPVNSPVAVKEAPEPVSDKSVLVAADLAKDGAQRSRPRVRVKTAQAKSAHAKPAAPAPDEPFYAIPYAMPIEPYERASLIRMDLPVSALIAAGVPTTLMDPNTRAQTDVLVGQDGRPRAIRLVSISTLN